jgi:hypothetical protein
VHKTPIDNLYGYRVLVLLHSNSRLQNATYFFFFTGFAAGRCDVFEDGRILGDTFG